MDKLSPPARRVLDCARSWLGTPYIHQASLKGVGCDCLGLVRGVWREIEGEEPETLPAYSSVWAETGGKEQLLQAANRHFVSVASGHAQPGDLVVFRLRPASIAKHCGIATDDCRFIHAYDGNAVVESALTEFWVKRIAGVFRFPSAVAGDA